MKKFNRVRPYMKYYIIAITIAILSVVSISGCSTKTQGQQSNITTGTTAKQPAIADYFPIRDDVLYTYEGKGNEFAAYTVFNDYTDKGKERVQQRVSNGGTVMAKVYQIKDGKLVRILSSGEVYYRENLLDAAAVENEEVLLMEPLTKGTSWTLKDGRKRSITGKDVDVETPAGRYKALEVTTEGSGGKTVDYFVQNVGLVKTVFHPGANEITSTLAKIEENRALTIRMGFYYPSTTQEKIAVKDTAVSFKTNDITRKILEAVYKDPVEGVGKVFSPNTTINSLYLNKDGMAYVDLNRAFINEMNAGSGYEAMILQCVANTFGHYYNVQKVILTIDGKLYESGHLAFGKGEFLQVDDKDILVIR